MKKQDQFEQLLSLLTVNERPNDFFISMSAVALKQTFTTRHKMKYNEIITFEAGKALHCCNNLKKNRFQTLRFI